MNVAAQSLTRLLIANAVGDGPMVLAELRGLCEGPAGSVGVIHDLVQLVTKMGVDQYGADWVNVLNLAHVELEFDGVDTADSDAEPNEG